MKLIDVSTPKYPNTFTMVDDEDFIHLSQWKWCAVTRRNTMYAQRHGSEYGNTKTYMHREVMTTAGKANVDHRDRNGLNNQKWNLRLATVGQNNCNARLSRSNSSGFVGVSWNKNAKKWEAFLRMNKKKRYLGRYTDKTKAAKIRDAAASEIYGEFARLNFP